MSLVLTDLGSKQMLKAFFNNNFPASKNLKLRLFATNVTPTDLSTLGSFVEAAGGGYAPISLTNGSWTVTPGNDPSDAVYAEQTFTFTGPLTTNPTIYGYYIEDNDGSAGVCLWAELLAAPFTPANNGDTVKITPRFQASKGTPT